jgi:hypothetical protein
MCVITDCTTHEEQGNVTRREQNRFHELERFAKTGEFTNRHPILKACASVRAEDLSQLSFHLDATALPSGVEEASHVVCIRYPSFVRNPLEHA